MFRTLMWAVLVALAALFLTPFEADVHARELSRSPDCKGLPSEAATEVPAPADRWARLDCRPYGQALLQNPDWTWRYTGKYMAEVSVAAVMGQAAQEAVGARYFLQLSVSTQDGETAAQLHARFLSELASYALHAGAATPRAVYRLEAINDLLDRITLYFLERTDGELWGVACTPQCSPENVFHIRRLGG